MPILLIYNLYNFKQYPILVHVQKGIHTPGIHMLDKL